MKVESVPIATLSQDPANARKHDDKNLEAIKASLRRFGQQKPIVVDSSNVVRAGNGTLAAATALGWDSINVVQTDLQGSEATAYAIADNRTAELAEWDESVLAASLSSLADVDETWLSDLQFSEKELAELVASTQEQEIIEDEVPDLTTDPVTQTGDLWILGEHRLLCGDSCEKKSYELLMRQRKANLVLTDPPYGMSYKSNMRTASKKFDELVNDDKILTDWIEHAKVNSNGWVFCFTTWKVLSQWIQPFRDFGELTNMIVWFKGGGGIGDLKKTFSTDHEIALVTNRDAELKGKRIGSVWTFAKDAATDYKHPTQKPVALLAEAIDKTTGKGDAVLDPFLGSGTTLIEAEQVGRTCFGMELSPQYCDVIVERWEKLTGKKARLEGGGATS